MNPQESLEFVRSLVTEFHEARPDDVPLDLDSLTVIHLMEAIEDRLDVRMAPHELTPEHFATISALAAFVARKAA